MKKFGILIDTAGGNNPAMYDGTDIRLLPLHIVFSNKEGTQVIDDITDTPEHVKESNFYERVKAGENITTSAAAPGELMMILNDMLKEYELVVYFPIPQNLSSMYQTAVMISNDDQYKGKFTVFEHSMAANGIKEFALALNKKLNDGVLTNIDEIAKFAKDYEDHMYLGIIPGDPSKLARGGRATKVISGILNLFKMKLLIRWTANPKKDGMSRTISGLVKIVDKHLREDYKDKSYKFIFVSTPLTTEKTLNSAIESLDKFEINYTKETIPTLYTAHAGVDTIGFVIVENL